MKLTSTFTSVLLAGMSWVASAHPTHREIVLAQACSPDTPLNMRLEIPMLASTERFRISQEDLRKKSKYKDCLVKGTQESFHVSNLGIHRRSPQTWVLGIDVVDKERLQLRQLLEKSIGKSLYLACNDKTIAWLHVQSVQSSTPEILYGAAIEARVAKKAIIYCR